MWGRGVYKGCRMWVSGKYMGCIMLCSGECRGCSVRSNGCTGCKVKCNGGAGSTECWGIGHTGGECNAWGVKFWCNMGAGWAEWGVRRDAE